MKELFLGYYPTKLESISIEVPTLVVFDANVLLNLYRYPATASEDLIRLMESLSDKVWLPYQAAFEYQRNRLVVIADQKRRFQDVQKVVTEGIASIDSKLKALQLEKRHSTIDVTKFLKSLAEAAGKLSSDLKEKERTQLDVRSDDQIRAKLDTIFNGKIGAKPTQEWLDSIFKSGESRYKSKIPPGYKDQDKSDEPVWYGGVSYKREYGDLVLWRQIVEHCKTIKPQQVVFVTDDDKEDWWQIAQSGGSRRISPRVELIEELAQDSGVSQFLMLSSEQFATRFSEILKVAIQQATVAQVRDVQSTLFETVHVACPSCAGEGACTLGQQAGASSMHLCQHCGLRFHVNRGGEGEVITREWGASKTNMAKNHRVLATCPICKNSVAANLRADESSTKRYCMNCCSLLEIEGDGAVCECTKSYAINASSVDIEDGSVFLKCPECSHSKPARALWNNGRMYRAVCPACKKLIESSFVSDIEID